MVKIIQCISKLKPIKFVFFLCYVALFTLMMFDLDAKLNGIIFLILFATLLWGIRVERLTVLISDG